MHRRNHHKEHRSIELNNHGVRIVGRFDRYSQEVVVVCHHTYLDSPEPVYHSFSAVLVAVLLLLQA